MLTAISMSAPTFTVEQEIIERKSLTHGEYQSIVDDLYGNHGGGARSEFLLKRKSSSSNLDNDDKLLLFHQALKNIPFEEKKSYLNAQRICPHVVETESRPELFLRRADGDVVFAANLLVKYWETRERVFGKELAFAPLTLEESLKNDRAIYDCKVWDHLPDDSRGRAVMYYNKQRMHKGIYNRCGLIRVVWYMMHKVLAQDYTKDFVVIADVRSYNVLTFDRKLGRRLVQTCCETLPLFVRALHICCAPHRSIIEVLCPMFKSMAGKYLRNRMIIHQADPKELLIEFQDYGFVASGLPPCLGGNLKQENRGKAALRRMASGHDSEDEKKDDEPYRWRTARRSGSTAHAA